MQASRLLNFLYLWISSTVLVLILLLSLVEYKNSHLISRVPPISERDRQYSTEVINWSKRLGVHWIEASFNRIYPGEYSHPVDTILYIRAACVTQTDCIKRKIIVSNALRKCDTKWDFLTVLGRALPVSTAKAPSDFCGQYLLFENGVIHGEMPKSLRKIIEEAILANLSKERLMTLESGKTKWNGSTRYSMSLPTEIFYDYEFDKR